MRFNTKTFKLFNSICPQSVAHFRSLFSDHIDNDIVVTDIYPMPTSITYVFSDGIELSIIGTSTLEQWYVETRRLTADEYITDVQVSMYNPRTGEIIEDNNYFLNKV